MNTSSRRLRNLRLEKIAAVCLFQFSVAGILSAEAPSGLQPAMAAFQTGNISEAERLARQAVDTAPQGAARVEARNFLGIILGQSGRYDEAVALFLANTQENPGDAGAYANLSEALRRSNRAEEGIAPLKKALELAPGSPLYTLKLRLARIQAGDDKGLSDEAARELKKSPPAPDWLLTAAAIALQQEDWQAATAILGQAKSSFNKDIYAEIILDPAFSRYAERPELGSLLSANAAVVPPGALTEKAFAAYQSGSYDIAIKLAGEALTAGEPLSHVATVRGAVFFAERKFPEAASAFEMAVKESPKDATLWLNLGEALRASGKPAEAARAFHEALTLSPRNEMFAVKLAFALIESGRAAEVLNERLTQISSGPLLVAKAAAAAQQGDLVQAAAMLETARKDLPPPMFSGLINDPLFQAHRDAPELKVLLTGAPAK
jgi:tetratricopeptide (TPR) repeat protein